MGWIPPIMGVHTLWPLGATIGQYVNDIRPSRMTIHNNDLPIALSIGIMTWNEEASIGPMLSSLFGQSVFAHLAARNEGC